MTRHQADRLLKRVMVYFLSAEGSPSSVASTKREMDVAGLVPPEARPAARPSPIGSAIVCHGRHAACHSCSPCPAHCPSVGGSRATTRASMYLRLPRDSALLMLMVSKPWTVPSRACALNATTGGCG